MEKSVLQSQISGILFKQRISPNLQQEPQFDQEHDQGEIQVLLTTKPHEFKHCKLKMERHDLAYAKPLNDPTLLIKITGRENVGRSFPGDEVCVQILYREPQVQEGEQVRGKVVGLMRRDEEHCTFICKIEGLDRLVTPVKNDMTRICIIQNKPDKIEIRKKDQFNSQLWVTDKFVDKAADQLLVVKVLKWRKECSYPLGVVTKVLSRKDYLYEMFQILSKKAGIKDTPVPSFQTREDTEDDEQREDFREDITFTIDSKGAQDLDDAISLTDNGETYVIAVHISDVASYISKDSEEDTLANQKGRTFYAPPEIQEEPVFMFSRKLSSEYLSLLPNKDRKTISLLVVVNKATNTIVSSRFTLSLIRSDRKLSYEDADRIIQERCLDNSGPLCFSSVRDCVATAYRFTEVHRKRRLDGGWSSGQGTEQSRAHCMVEELMNLYNSAVAEELISADLTKDLTPLRCHQEPDHEELEDFKMNYSALLPLSPYLSHICEVEDFQEEEEFNEVWTDEEEQEEEEETESIQDDDMSFTVITPVLQKMKDLAENKDYHSLVQLIISDNIHPKLRPMAKEFQDLQNKAVTLRSCSSLASKLGHFGLQLNAYTRASSPIRRYLDLILQRLLHSVLCGKEKVDYTTAEIDQFCDSWTKQSDYAEDFNLQALEFITTSKFSSRVVTKLAVVDQLPPKGHEFMISLPFDQVCTEFTILYRHLKVVEQPKYSTDNKSITLHWKRRIYSFSNRLKTHSKFSRNVTSISVNKWRRIVSAVKVEDWDMVRRCLQDVSTTANRNPERLTKEACSRDSQHFKKFDMELKSGEVIQVQLGAEIVKGMTTPTVKLLNINPLFEVCLEHARNPTMCFFKDVCDASKTKYANYTEYQKIWRGICKTDTAYNAVQENNSVILEDVKITWEQGTDLKGFFQMTQTLKKEWQLDFDLTNCFLCIRLRDYDLKPLPHLVHKLDHLPPLNKSQKIAVQRALQNSFTVIQGPPGTGKTVVGVHITYQFYMKNKASEAEQIKQDSCSDQKKEKKRGILYCGPSNKSVDIVAEQLMKLNDVLKPLRIYCDQMEMREFPYPGSDLKLCHKSFRDEKPKDKLRDITLMYLVRKHENPYSKEIANFENLMDPEAFNTESYRKLLKEAQKYELMRHDVVLCTCSTALNPNLIETMDFRQILIDECAMATEPEAFIPLVSHNPQQIVILGDHKQIQPIVTCGRVKELGMQKSLFERYMDNALMLDTQYRMHESICKFPSQEFYEDKLTTGAERAGGPLLLLNKKNAPTAILFGHVQGEETSLVVSTAAGNEHSVANKLEAQRAVGVAAMLIHQSGVKPEKIAILTPYNAQVCEIKKSMEEMKKKRKSIEGVNLCTIMKSQGSEWPYVIISTVRSCPLSEIKPEPNPSKAWMGKKLGFITDPNQVNVAITRAQDGLCILGNSHLLKCSYLWRKLLIHYENQDCVMDSAQVSTVVT
ncbi:hypothetical protein MHYP_G00220650 [Metynnis hypsauchen]